MKVRIQKYLSEQGILSRRTAEKYIKKGWIKVNGTTVTEMGLKIDPETDRVELVEAAQEIASTHLYLAFHKPRGIVTNCPTPNEKEIKDLLPKSLQHVFAIGRLDKESEGLILLTSDGIFAKNCLQSNPPHTRTYEVTIQHPLTDIQKGKLETGMTLFGKKTKPLTIEFIAPKTFKMTMIEGKNRQIRRMLQKVGHRVVKLKRLSFAHISLGKIKLGQFQKLTEKDIHKFSN